MAAGILLSNDAFWSTKGLFFEHLLEGVRERYRSDRELVGNIGDLIAVGGISLEEMAPEFRTRLARMIFTVAIEAVENSSHAPLINEQGQDLSIVYRDELKRLIDLFDRDGRYNRRLLTLTFPPSSAHP